MKGNDPTAERLKIYGTSFSIKVLPGYLFEKSGLVVHGIFGVKWRKAKSELHFVAGKVVDFSDSLNGPQILFGLGLEKRIATNTTVYLSYEYAWRSRHFYSNSHLLVNVNENVRIASRKGIFSLNTHSIQIGARCYCW